MPELPEVETLRRELTKAVKAKTVKDFWTDWPKNVKPSASTVKTKIKGKTILDIRRRAKILIIKLSGGNFLLIHLKLTGQLIYQPKKLPATSYKLIAGGHPQKGGLDNLPNKFTHYIFSFSDGAKLFFNDLRKFGWVKLVSKLQADKLVSDFGIEPFTRDFTLKKFTEILQRYPNRKIKQILLDQTLISGLGNIYCDESCFAAKILPTRIARMLKEQEIKRLFLVIPKILKLAIDKKGTSADTYVQLDGSQGGMIPYLKVYGRQKQKCKRCRGLIHKIKLNGRGTHFCNSCQH